MSQENVDVVQRTIEGWNRRDLDAMLRTAAPDIEYVNSPLAVEPGVRRGRDEYGAVLRSQWEVVGDARLEIESIRTIDDDAFVLLRMSRTLVGSDSLVEARIGMRMTFRRGQLTRQEVIPSDDFPSALEAARLSE